MISNFTYFLYNNDAQDYLNCYSTFLMTRKDLKENILNHRMNFMINYYISQQKLESIQKHKLIQYYINSYKDNYINKSVRIRNGNCNVNVNVNNDVNVNVNNDVNGNVNNDINNDDVNSNVNNAINNSNINDVNDDDVNDDDDIDDHYKYMFVNTKPKAEIIDYDELDKEYALKLELEEDEKRREKEIQLENDYDDYNNDDDNYDIVDEYSEDELLFDDDCYY
jgi:hypothetical protein